MIISGDIGPLSELGQGDGDNVPLYKRGAEPEPREQEIQEVQGKVMPRLRDTERGEKNRVGYSPLFYLIRSITDSQFIRHYYNSPIWHRVLLLLS